MKPTFIGIGPARCGTTSIYYYLKQHPQVFMSPIKETHFFTYQASRTEFADGRAVVGVHARSWSEYELLFMQSGAAKAVGEISPSYFWWPGVPDLIHEALPDVRLFCILRNPIERAYSSYRMHADDGNEPRSFEQAVQDELEAPSEYPLAATNYYVRIGFYSRHLERYMELFERSQLKICFYDDLESSADPFMRELFAFLGVDCNLAVDTSSRFNTWGVRRIERRWRSRGVGRFVKRLRAFVPQRLYYLAYRRYSASPGAAAAVPSVPGEMRERLRDAYSGDIEALQRLTGRDLSHWLKV